MKRSAFTMVEMVIALGIISFMLVLVIPKLTRTFQEWQQKQFWNELKQEWQLSQVRSQNHGEITDISYDQQDRAIIFCSKNNQRRINVPHSIRVREIKPRTMLSNGYIQPAT